MWKSQCDSLCGPRARPLLLCMIGPSKQKISHLTSTIGSSKNEQRKEGSNYVFHWKMILTDPTGQTSSTTRRCRLLLPLCQRAIASGDDKMIVVFKGGAIRVTQGGCDRDKSRAKATIFLGWQQEPERQKNKKRSLPIVIGNNL